MTPFTAWSGDHVVALALVGGGCALAGKSLSPNSRFRSLGRKFLAVLLAAFLILVQMFRLEDGFQWAYDLPLQLCDLVYFMALLSLFVQHKLLLECTYYWALAGTLQALLTPDVRHAFPSSEFLLFFFGHGLIVVTVVAALAYWGFEPGPRSAFRAFGVLVVYTVVVAGLDYLGGWNYGYFMAKPEQPSVLDYLGPWPIYILGGLGVAGLLFMVLYCPWWILRLRRDDSTHPAEP